MITAYFVALVLLIWLASLAIPYAVFNIQDSIARSRRTGLLGLLAQSTEMAGSRLGGLLLALYIMGVRR